MNIRWTYELVDKAWATIMGSFPQWRKGEKQQDHDNKKKVCKRKVVKTTTKMVKDCQKKSKTFHIFLSSRRKNRNNGDD